MKINAAALQLHNLIFSEENKENQEDFNQEDFETKQEMLEVLKKRRGYTGRDENIQSEKRARRTKIREFAGNDPEKIISLKGLLYTEEEKRELTSCPFRWHKGYAELWNSLDSDKQKEMRKNIKISTDGKIEMIKMRKKFSILQAKHNGRHIFDGSYRDKQGNTGIKGITYMTGRAAERECAKQGKKLLDGKPEVNQFINFFPGENMREKVFSFIKLFELGKSGYLNAYDKEWSDDVGSMGYAALSKVDVLGNVYETKWSDDNTFMDRGNQRCPSPFVACEDIPQAA